MNRNEAIERGLTRYRSKPCKRGHNGERFVSNGRCVECQIAENNERNKRKLENPEMEKLNRKMSSKQKRAALPVVECPKCDEPMYVIYLCRSAVDKKDMWRGYHCKSCESAGVPKVRWRVVDGKIVEKIESDNRDKWGKSMQKRMEGKIPTNVDPRARVYLMGKLVVDENL